MNDAIRTRDCVIADLTAECKSLRAELAAEKAKVLRAVRGEFGQICSYCGWESAPEGASWEELQAHIHECEAHPIAALKRQVADLTSQLAAKEEVNEMLLNRLRELGDAN